MAQNMMIQIDYTSPTEWPESFELGTASCQNAKDLDALRLAIIERISCMDISAAAFSSIYYLYTTDYIPVSGKALDSDILNGYHYAIRQLFRFYLNHIRFYSVGCTLDNMVWTERDMLDYMEITEYQYPQPYDMDNTEWIMQQYEILNLLKYPVISFDSSNPYGYIGGPFKWEYLGYVNNKHSWYADRTFEGVRDSFANATESNPGECPYFTAGYYGCVLLRSFDFTEFEPYIDSEIGRFERVFNLNNYTIDIDFIAAAVVPKKSIFPSQNARGFSDSIYFSPVGVFLENRKLYLLKTETNLSGIQRLNTGTLPVETVDEFNPYVANMQYRSGMCIIADNCFAVLKMDGINGFKFRGADW